MNDAPGPDNPTAIRQRARLLLDQGRHADAAEWFQRLLAIEPEDAYALSQLAICWSQLPDKKEQALTAARQAIRLEPDESFHHSVLALTLLDTAKVGQDAQVREGLASAEKAIELDPDSSLAHSLNGMALLRLGKYADAEKSARHALSLDTSDTLATQVLSMSLLNQKKDADLDSLVDWQLMENPEDDTAHVSAGYRDLMRGRHREACEHFREALRIDPSHEGARSGLIESFRARSWFYRLHLRFSYFMAQFGQKGAGGILLAGFVLYRLVFGMLKKNHPGWAYTLAGLWMVFALWSFLARGVGSALMLTDRFVRMAITKRERWEGVCVGALVSMALFSLVWGLWWHRMDWVLSALACFLAAVPVASAFANDHHWGRWVYTGLGVVAGTAAVAFFLGVLFGWPPFFEGLDLMTAIYVGGATTWLRFLGVLYR